MEDAEAKINYLLEVIEALKEDNEKLKTAKEDEKRQLDWWSGLKSADRLIELDFGIKPAVRHGHGKPTDPLIEKVIASRRDVYARHLTSFSRLADYFGSIPLIQSADGTPSWRNDWIPALDGISISGFLVDRNPATYLEIGSGVSTTFARKAITDHKLRTKIISIDPYPRSEINDICDHVIRDKLENVDLSIFSGLEKDDIVFCDSSHRAFQNSDVTVFFTEIVPMLANGPLIGVHDIFLPIDYPEEWLPRFYSEQYMLQCALLYGNRFDIESASMYCTYDAELHSILNPVFKQPSLQGANHSGGSFWWTLRE